MRCSAIGLLVTFALGLSILAVPLVADAQPVGKVYRIGRLSAGPPLELNPGWEAFRQGLRDLGYVEGQNLVLEYRYAEGREERLSALAAELVQLQVDVIVAGGPAIRAAQHATSTIPIVMAVTSDPVKAGYVASLARPGGNITGVSFLGAEITGKRLELLKEMVPQSTRIAVLVHPTNPAYGALMHDLTVTAQALGLQLHVLELHRPDELDPAFAAMRHEGAEALFVAEDPLLIDHLRGRIAALAATHRLPAIYYWKMSVEAGGLMAYGPSMPDLQRRAATYVDKILKGTQPGELPVEGPMKFDLVINLKTAQALGITIPPTLLVLADEVIR